MNPKKFAFMAKGRSGRRRHIPGQANKTEQRYLDFLQLRLLANEIEYFEFESVTFKIAPDLRYTPDVMVLTNNLTLEFHDVKAGIKQKSRDGSGSYTGKVVPKVEDDARAKIILCAEKWPFLTFCTVWEDGTGNWVRRDY